MSDFKAKMHQIRFRLGLRPRPRSGDLQRSPRPHSRILGKSPTGMPRAATTRFYSRAVTWLTVWPPVEFRTSHVYTSARIVDHTWPPHAGRWSSQRQGHSSPSVTYTEWNDVTKSMVAICSPFCGYDNILKIFEIRKWFTPSFVDKFLQDIPSWAI